MGWTTKDEVNYLIGLGTYRNEPRDRKVLLTKYIHAADKRVKWEGMNKEWIINRAKELLMTGKVR